jgi:hypothetical protein
MKKRESRLEFPTLKTPAMPPALRTIDEINEWIEHDYKYFFDRAVYEKEERRLSVNKRFVLKD